MQPLRNSKAVLIMLFPVICMGGECKTPQWSGLPLPRNYIGVEGIGADQEKAVASAYGQIVNSVGAGNIRSITTEIFNLQTSSNNRDNDSAAIKSKGSGGNDFMTPAFRIIESTMFNAPCPDDSFHCFLLACTAASSTGCGITYPSNIGATVLSILPGCGHIYKKRTSRGVAFLCSFLTSVAASGICYLASDRMYNSALNARTPAVRQQYASQHDGLLFTSGALAIAGLAIYGWNIYDAYTIQGVPEFW